MRSQEDFSASGASAGVQEPPDELEPHTSSLAALPGQDCGI